MFEWMSIIAFTGIVAIVVSLISLCMAYKRYGITNQISSSEMKTRLFLKMISMEEKINLRDNLQKMALDYQYKVRNDKSKKINLKNDTVFQSIYNIPMQHSFVNEINFVDYYSYLSLINIILENIRKKIINDDEFWDPYLTMAFYYKSFITNNFFLPEPRLSNPCPEMELYVKKIDVKRLRGYPR